MDAETKGYAIYDLKTGQEVARIGADGIVQDEGDPQAVEKLKALMQCEIVVRENQLGAGCGIGEGQEDEEYDAFPEENMCYFGVITLIPGDPAYLAAFTRRLPYISYYEAHPVK